MFYGSAPVAEFRLDLPVLYVRAGLDRPGVNRDITTLAALAVSQNAPVTLVNHPLQRGAAFFDRSHQFRDPSPGHSDRHATVRPDESAR